MRRLAFWIGMVSTTSGVVHAQPLDCPVDPSLERAAAELVVSDRPLDGEAIAQAVQRADSDRPSVQGIRIASDDHGTAVDWLASIRDRGDAEITCGAAVREGRRILLAAYRGGTIILDPNHVAHVHLDDGFRDGRLVIEYRDHSIERLAVDDELLRRGVEFDPDEVHTIQLVALGPRGVRPVAVRHIQDGASRGIAAAPPRDIAATIRWVRQLAGVSELRHNQLFDRLATQHAAAVCEARRALHETTPGRDPEWRLRQQGLQARVVGEVVARAPSREASIRALLESPSHRGTISDARFTDFGSGEVEDEGVTCLVAIFAAWPRTF